MNHYHNQELVSEFKKDPIGFVELLRDVAPVLYTITKLNNKLLQDMMYGEITITQYIKKGKIYRIEAIPKIGELVEDA